MKERELAQRCVSSRGVASASGAERAACYVGTGVLQWWFGEKPRRIGGTRVRDGHFLTEWSCQSSRREVANRRLGCRGCSSVGGRRVVVHAGDRSGHFAEDFQGGGV